MKLSKEALERIDKTKIRMRLGVALGVGETSIRNYIRDNDENGLLTTVTALQIIFEETGMTQDEVLISQNHAA